jgi:hypothetical protein
VERRNPSVAAGERRAQVHAGECHAGAERGRFDARRRAQHVEQTLPELLLRGGVGVARRREREAGDQHLRGYSGLAAGEMQVIFYLAPFPAGEAIRQKALAAGLETPAQINRRRSSGGYKNREAYAALRMSQLRNSPLRRAEGKIIYLSEEHDLDWNAIDQRPSHRKSEVANPFPLPSSASLPKIDADSGLIRAVEGGRG